MSTNINDIINQPPLNQLGAAKLTKQETKPVVKKEAAKTPVKVDLKDEFKKTRRKDGLVEKFYNFLKNKTNAGHASNKVDSIIEQAETGKLTEKDAENAISKYRKSQENAEQTFGDVLSATAAISGFYFVNKYANWARSAVKINALGLFSYILSGKSKKVQLIKNVLGSKTKGAFIATGAAAGIGALTKFWALKLNRTGSKEFKIETKEGKDKAQIKKEKKSLNRARRWQNFKNFLTGGINGLLAPVTILAGGFVGVPAYLAGITGIRYLANKDNKVKSFKDLGDNLKDNIAVNAIGTVALGALALKKANFRKVFVENLSKVESKLKGVKLKAPDLPSNKTAYQELDDLLTGSESVKRILSKGSVDEQIIALTKENIFAIKFIQIRNNNLNALNAEGFAMDNLATALKENCPPSRTVAQAQKAINTLLKSTGYEVKKLLGVGTIAETYLAKDKSGKEVCIKILKDGISKEKILADKEKFRQLVINGTKPEKYTDSQRYLLQNIDNLSDGILKEVDFVNEMEAAKKLAKHTGKANVVVPIKAEPGVYIMERANGISLDTLINYWSLQSDKNYYQKVLNKGSFKDEGMKEWYKKDLKEVNEKIAKIKAKAPDFDDFELSSAEIKKMLYNYIDVQTEQFYKVGNGGKILHADIHPGNIFIDIGVIKGTKKGKMFTLIDTGNTIELTRDQALKSMKLTSLIKNGNYKNITAYVLEGAALPKGMTKEKAVELVEKELKTIFFDNSTNIESMNGDSVIKLTSNIMRKYNIIPADTQLTLNKAKTSAYNSFKGILKNFFNKKYENQEENAKTIGAAIKDMALISKQYKLASTTQEAKNLLHMPWIEAWANFRNPNRLKENSEDYITYKMKQWINEADDKFVEDLNK